MVKRAVFVILAMIFVALPTLAANTVTLGCENMEVKQGEFFTVPLSLTKNDGIVAARIKIKYPDKVMELTDISSGELTEEGLFNTTVTDFYSVKGEFDVVWSTTEDVIGDGTFVMLTFKASDLAENGRYKIELSYDKADTFNENLQDVKLQCVPVVVTINDGTGVFDEPETEDVTEEHTTPAGEITTEEPRKEDENNGEKTEDTEETKAPGTTELTESVTVSDDYLISSVDSVLSSLQIGNIDEVTDPSTQQIVLDFVNNRIEAYSPDAEKIESFEELKEQYLTALENEAVKDIVESTDDDVILDTFEEIVQDTGKEDITKVPEEKKKDVIKKFTDKLTESNSDIQQFNRLKDEQKLTVLGKVVDEVVKRDESSIEVNSEAPPEKDYTIIIGIGVAVAIATAIGVTVLVIRKKKSNKGEKR